ncbi:MAG: arabinogalactan oligomer/maltooligosaccharide transport system permease protein [Polyangiales bacterium]|jgi:arabinogalactan oligomer/maltooligosaccharide transport system permease protein
MIRWFSAALLIGAFSLGSSRQATAQDVVLWHAYSDREQEILEQLLSTFEQEEGVHVEAVRLPFGVLSSRLESAVRTGNGPDVFIDAHERLGRYVRSGIVQPLGDDVGASLSLDEGHVDALRFEGQRYGLPLSAKGLALYVNAEYAPYNLEGRTLDELIRAAPPPDVWPLVLEGENGYYAAPFFHAFGAELFEAPDRFAANSPEGTQALTRLAEYFDDGIIPPEPSGALVAQLFGSGQAVYAISGPWLASSLPDSLRYRVLPLPSLDGAGPLRSLVTIEAVMRAQSPQNANADKLLAFLAGEESARVRNVTLDQQVSHACTWAPTCAESRIIDSSGGVLMPSHPNMSQVFEPLSHAIRGVVRGGQDPEQALADAESRFARAVRPLPEEKDTTFGLLLAGALLLLLSFFALQKARSADFRSAVKSSLPAYRYVSVAGIAVLLLVVGPLVVGALMSLFATDGSEIRYVGFTHYAAILSGDGLGLFANGSFWRVLFVTAVWTVLNLALHVALGIGLALLLHRPGLRFRSLYRVLLIVPWAVPNYVTALSWKGMFHSQYGAINAIIEAAGGESIQWFSRFATAFAANITTNVWLGFPFMMVVALGALSAIPKELYEAAKVDGATPFQRLRYITLPMLWPTMIPAIAMGAVWTFNMFNVVFLVSGGEPGGSTEILVSEAYRWAFTRGARYGYAAAYAVLIFGVLWLSTRSRVVRRALS